MPSASGQLSASGPKPIKPSRPPNESPAEAGEAAGSAGPSTNPRPVRRQGAAASEPLPDQAEPPPASYSGIELARCARDAALEVPGVARVGAGSVVATYGKPGETVQGVRISRQSEREIRVEIHLAVHAVPLSSLADAVRRIVVQRLSPMAACRHVDICVDSIEDPQ